MVSEQDTRRCVSEEAEPVRGVDIRRCASEDARPQRGWIGGPILIGEGNKCQRGCCAPKGGGL